MANELEFSRCSQVTSWVCATRCGCTIAVAVGGLFCRCYERRHRVDGSLPTNFETARKQYRIRASPVVCIIIKESRGKL